MKGDVLMAEPFSEPFSGKRYQSHFVSCPDAKRWRHA
jgi:hypothetical protein